MVFVLLLAPRAVLSFDVQLSDTMPQQGDVVTIKVSDTEACTVEGRWNKHSFKFQKTSDSDAKFYGLIGIDYTRTPGFAQLLIHTDPCDPDQSPRTQTIKLLVAEQSFRTQRLTVPDQEKVTLSPESLERVHREKKQIRTALDKHRTAPVWRFPFASPVGRYQAGNSFGARRIINGNPRSPHSGEDYSANVGDPIKSIAGGKVVLTGTFFFEGNTIFIDHGAGLQSMYFHLSEIDVREGKKVEAGEKIGEAGASGRVTGPHLHLGIKLHGSTVDPDSLFQQALPD